MAGFKDRRQYPRTPKLMRFMLLWKRVEEKAFTTDVSQNGMFVRTSIAPPQGAQITLLLPEGRPREECVRIEATVVRIVRRGDPSNPLGGIAVSFERIISPRGTQPIIELLTTLLGNFGFEIPVRKGPYVVELPAGHVRPYVDAQAEQADQGEEIGFDEIPPVTAEMAVFCRLNNMVMKATLVQLGTNQAILTGLKVKPEVGDRVSVRMISGTQTVFKGVEFTGQIDQVQSDASGSSTMSGFVSVAIDPLSEQKDRGGLRSVLNQISENKGKH